MSNPGADITPSSLYTMIATELFGQTVQVAPRRIGIELELFPLMQSPEGDLCRVPFDPVDGGLRGWLIELAASEEWSIDECDGGDLRITTASGGTITLEPAGQVEYSGPPLESCEDALADLDAMVATLERSAARHGIVLQTRGYNSMIPEPEHCLIITKPRYLAMDRYFARIGPYGRRMMRSTCALQINLDFGTAAEAPERWRLANMIAPSLNAIFANAPMTVDGRHYRSYRYEIWRHADPGRTGRLFDRPDLDPIADYLRFALDAGVMLARDERGEVVPVEKEMTFRTWIDGVPGLRAPDLDDWRLHLTTLFPDVRARGYMEIRSIDALPAGPRDVAVAMVAALMYNSSLRRDAIRRLERRERTRREAEHEHDGFWGSDYTTGRELLEMAIPAMESERLRGLAKEYLEKVRRG